MVVFKYMPAQVALQHYFKNWHLKYSMPRDFNDPFDVLPHITEPQAHAILESFRLSQATSSGKPSEPLPPPHLGMNLSSGYADSVRHMLDNMYGVLCFTRTRRHPLMWAHYADCHRGLLLEFDAQHECFRRSNNGRKVGRLLPVRYSDERPRLTKFTSEVLENAYLTKALEWAHEQEMRLLWPVEQPDLCHGDVLLYHIPPAALRRVVLGCRATADTAARVMRALDAPATSHVAIEKASMRSYDFTLAYSPLAATRPSIDIQSSDEAAGASGSDATAGG